MALEKCRECGHEVSTAATACPNCGARRRSGVGRAAVAAAGVVALAVAMYAIGSNGGDRAGPAAAPPTSDPTVAVPELPRDGALDGLPPVVLAPPPPPAPRDLCREYRTQLRVDSIAREIAKRNMLLAQQIHGQNRGCSFYPQEGIARVDLLVSWESMGGHTPYWLSGTLDLTDDAWRWNPGAANENLRQVKRDWSEVKIGLGVAGLAAIAWLASKATDTGDAPRAEAPRAGAPRPEAPRRERSGTAVACLWNRTSVPLRFQRRWLGESGWASDSLAAGEGVRLTSPADDTLQLRLDIGLDDGLTMRTYDIPAVRLATTTQPPCQAGSSYDMRIGADTIGIWIP